GDVSTDLRILRVRRDRDARAEPRVEPDDDLIVDAILDLRAGHRGDAEAQRATPATPRPRFTSTPRPIDHSRVGLNATARPTGNVMPKNILSKYEPVAWLKSLSSVPV